MHTAAIAGKFARMGARARFRGPQRWSRGMIDIARDRHGELFDFTIDAGDEVLVLDVQPKDRHLLLMVRQGEHPDRKHKFLCGHDERHWFVAAVPGRSVSSVGQAKQALKPDGVVAAEGRTTLKRKDRHRRRNRAFLRQGEWFFVPASKELGVDESLVLRHEPLRRGAGKPHWVEQLFRTGGQTVYVSRWAPNGLDEAAYRAYVRRHPARRGPWQEMRRDPKVYARGTVRHADHATIRLDGWHRVHMNTETQSAAMQHVAFLD